MIDPLAPLSEGNTLALGLSVVRALGRVGEGLVYRLDNADGAALELRQYAPPVGPPSDRSPELAAALEQGAIAFLALGRSLSGLHAASIQRVRQVIEKDGAAFWVMDAAGDWTLGQQLPAAPVRPLDPPRLANLALQLTPALSALHGAGLLHLDLSPQTLAETGRSAWTLTGASTDRRPLMKPFGGQAGLCRPPYAAPELQDGTATAPLTPATDLYALCATLRHALTGTPPPDWMDRLRGAPLLADLGHGAYPTALLALIDLGMAVRPGERMESVHAWWALARPHLESFAPPTRSSPTLTPAAPLVAAAALALAGEALAGKTTAQDAVAEPQETAPNEVVVTPPTIDTPHATELAPPSAEMAAPLTLPPVKRPARVPWGPLAIVAAGALAVAASAAGYWGLQQWAGRNQPYYAARTAVVRDRPDPQGHEIDERERGSRLIGHTVPSVSGTPWLAIDAGPDKGGFVSTKSLIRQPPPSIDTDAEASRTLSQPAAARLAPNPGAAGGDALRAGTRVEVTGRTPQGWYEILRTTGGVEYLPPETFAMRTSLAAPSAPPELAAVVPAIAAIANEVAKATSTPLKPQADERPTSLATARPTEAPRPASARPTQAPPSRPVSAPILAARAPAPSIPQPHPATPTRPPASVAVQAPRAAPSAPPKTIASDADEVESDIAPKRFAATASNRAVPAKGRLATTVHASSSDVKSGGGVRIADDIDDRPSSSSSAKTASASRVIAQPANAVRPTLSPGARPAMIRSVTIIQSPAQRDILRVYPRFARLNAISTSVTVECGVASSGALIDCRSVQTATPGVGFEAAAARLGELYVIGKTDRDGYLTAGRHIAFPIRFDLAAVPPR